jgi:hypothetical protein
MAFFMGGYYLVTMVAIGTTTSLASMLARRERQAARSSPHESRGP